jgi:hypothetical protein
MNRNYTPTRPLIRCALAAVALIATVANWSFVDQLARGYATEALRAAATRQVASAQPGR